MAKKTDRAVVTKVEKILTVELQSPGKLLIRQDVAFHRDAKGAPIYVNLVNFHTPCVEYRGRFAIFPLSELVRVGVEVITKALEQEKVSVKKKRSSK